MYPSLEDGKEDSLPLGLEVSELVSYLVSFFVSA